MDYSVIGPYQGVLSGLFILDVRKDLHIPKVIGDSRGGEVMIGGRPTFLLNILIVY